MKLLWEKGGALCLDGENEGRKPHGLSKRRGGKY
jgi:hypothetical protein